jgi:fatty-acyl-CoA synthase
MNIHLLLEMAADAFPDRIAIGGHEDGINYARLFAQSRRAAVALQSKPFATVAFLGLNSATLPAALFSSSMAGKPFAPLNYRLADADLCRLVARTSPSALIVDDAMVGRIEAVGGVDVLPRTHFQMIAEAPPGVSNLPEASSELAVLLFTSGTTGEPKAAVLRHRNLTSYVISTVELMAADPSEAALVSVPSYHIAALSAVLTSVYAGRRIVYLPAFTADAWVETALTERITHAMIVPTMLALILDVVAARGHGLPHLRALSYGGGRMPVSVIERAMEMLPDVDFVNAYGLTETSSTIAMLTPGDHRAAITSPDVTVRRRLGSVGKPLPTVDLEVRDRDGSVLPAGEVGEIFVRGDQIAGEYLGKSMLNAAGWFPTKDSGWVDEAGYLFVEGRLDDVIVRGGENISPGEIEDCLRSHPAVADVAVVGIPDDRWGEKIAAVIVPVPGELPSQEELAAWVRQTLRSIKTPETWAFRSELPYNETGKLLRRLIRAELAREAVDA